MDGSKHPAPAHPEPPTRPRPGAGDVDLLAAERAASRYWRSVAEQRRRDASATTSRPLVRAAVAVDRRTARVTARAAASLRSTVPRATLALRSLARVARGPAGDDTPATAPAPEGRPLRVALVVLGSDPAPAAEGVDLVAGPPRPGDEVDAVALVGPGLRPRTVGWLATLAAAAADTGGAVAPLVAHPRRRGLSRTPFDGRVRAAGIDVRVQRGAPVPVARGAGTDVARAAHLGSGLLVAGPALVVAGAAWHGVGGCRAALGHDAAFLDLGLRLRRAGHPVATWPRVVVDDLRPVARPAHLRSGVAPDGDGWRRTVAAHGPALRRSATPAGEPLTVALTTAVPNRRLAERWGDWHLAEGLAAGFRRAGHPARTGVLPTAGDLATRAADVHIVVRGLEPVARTEGQVQVLWVVSHPEAVTVEECDEADLVLVASPRFAAHLRALTTTPVEVVLQGTDAERFRPSPPVAAHAHAVTVVANRRGARRVAVADAVAAGLDLAVYGSGWVGHVPPGVLVADHVANRDLPAVYGSAGVVLNDHWETMREWGFPSNRLFDVAACGTPLLSDPVPGLDDIFDGLVATWTSPEELRDAVDRLAHEPARTLRRAAQACALVRAHHTLEARAAQILDLLTAHDLVEGRS